MKYNKHWICLQAHFTIKCWTDIELLPLPCESDRVDMSYKVRQRWYQDDTLPLTFWIVQIPHKNVALTLWDKWVPKFEAGHVLVVSYLEQKAS